MKKLILLLALLLSGGVSSDAFSASPSLSVTPSITNSNTDGERVAPLCVFFDATATTDADETQPFRTILHTASFGDTAAGTWSYGSRVGTSKNKHKGGPLASHCYYTPGSYTWTWRAEDSSGNTTSTSGPITVTSPDTIFAANTACVYNSSVGSGCPASSTEFTSADLDAVVSSAQGANGCGTGVPCKRILFKAGDTFTASSEALVTTAGPGIIGSYGAANSGRAIFTASDTTSTAFVVTFGNASLNVTGWRLMDVEITMSAATNYYHKSAVCIGCGYDASYFISMLNLYIHDIGDAIKVFPQGGDGYPITNVTIQDFDIQDIASGTAPSCASTDNNVGGKGVAMYAENSAVMGGQVNSTVRGEHNMRFEQWNKLVVSDNFMRNANNIDTPCRGSKESLSMRNDWPTGGTSRYAWIADNRFEILGYAGIDFTCSGNTSLCTQSMDDVIVERNWFYTVTNTGGIASSKVSGLNRITLRNNIFDLSAAGASPTGLFTYKYASARVTDDVLVANNTIFHSGITTGSWNMNVLDSTTTNATLINNLAYLPNRSSGTQDLVSGASPTETTNSAPPFTTDPSFASATPSSPQDFLLQSGSSVKTGGTVLFPATKADFNGCYDGTAAQYRLGAFVPTSLAICPTVGGTIYLPIRLSWLDFIGMMDNVKPVTRDIRAAAH